MAKLMKEPSGVAAKVETLVRPAVEALGLRLWDVRFEREAGAWVLRVLVDRDGVMDTDACEAASRAIDPLLDEADPIAQSYLLEVGSPGLGRQLTRRHHFEQMTGRPVQVKLYAPDSAGRKELRGVLERAGDGVLALALEGGEGAVQVPLAAAALVKLCDDENLF